MVFDGWLPTVLMLNCLVDLIIWAGMIPQAFDGWYKLNPVVKSVSKPHTPFSTLTP